jgi:serine/threonine protein kinase
MKTFGKYQLLEEIGKGAAGMTYRACDQLSGREVVIKVLNSAGVSPEAKLRFCRELTACSELQHPSIVKMVDIGEVDGAIYAATELLHGMDLRRHLAERRELSLARKLKLIAQVYDGLAFAHGKQAIHGDIKPANIFLTDQFEPKILDFGIAKFPLPEERTRLANYLAPEQILEEAGDARSDVYSAAVVLYEFLTNTFPFPASDGLIPREIVNTEPKRLRKLDRQIPEELERLVAEALAKDPKRRPQTAEILVVSLCAIAEQLQRAQSASSSGIQSTPEARVIDLADTAEMPCLIPLAAAMAAAGATGGAMGSRDARLSVTGLSGLPASVCETSKPDASASAAAQPALDGALGADRSERTASEVTRLSDTPKVSKPAPEAVKPAVQAPVQAPVEAPVEALVQAPVQAPANVIAQPVVPAAPKPSSATATQVAEKRPLVRRGIAIAAAAVVGIFALVGLLSRQSSNATQPGGSIATQNGGASARPAEAAPAAQPVAVAVPPVAVEAPKTQGSAEKMLTEQVGALWESGDYGQALTLVNAILAAEPENAEAVAWKKKIRAAQDAEAALK